MSDAALDELARRLGALARRDEPLGPRTTYRVGGPAAVWVEPADVEDLRLVHAALAAADEPVAVLVVGKGSNLLVADAGFRGLALSLGAGFSWVSIEDETVRAGGASSFPVVARQSAAAGLRGLEWAVGVPGSVGGALRMNAGGHGSQTADVLARFCLFDLRQGDERELAAAELQAGYRTSAVGDDQVVVWAAFTLQAGDVDQAQSEVSEVVRWRRANQPGGSNAGSVFTNPAQAPAGHLIDEAGLKGRRSGTAQVSPKHANFIQADDGGSADDVRRLIDLVRTEVLARTGVELIPELHMVGFAQEGAPSPSSRG